MNKNKIVIDAISLLSPLTGIGRYTYEVSKRLLEIDSYDINFYYGYYSKRIIDNHTNNSFIEFIKKSFFLKKMIRYALIKYSQLNNKKFELYWQPNFIPIETINAKKIVTSVHDFSFIYYKDFHPKERIEYFNKYFFKNIKRSDIIITGSNFTKNEIIDKLDISENKVKVIYHGIDKEIFKVYKNFNLDYVLPEKFLLCVGSIEPRKNLLNLLRAYNLLNKNIKKYYKMVIVGFKGWHNKNIMELKLL